MGAKINGPKSLVQNHEYFFSEDQGRYIIEIEKNNLEKVTKILNKNSVFYEKVGITQKNNLSLDKEFDIKVTELKNHYDNWFNKYID